MKQCGRRKLVEIEAPRTLSEFLAAETESSDRKLIVFNERGGVPVEQALAGISTPSLIIAMIGPEGGWSNPELELLTQSGSTSVTLGRRVLRTETAAIVALTLIQHLAGDLSV